MSPRQALRDCARNLENLSHDHKSELVGASSGLCPLPGTVVEAKNANSNVVVHTYM